MAHELANRVCLVTGAASGIGAAVATRLAAAGARLVLTDIASDAVTAAAARFRDDGVLALAITHDVADESAWQTAIAATEAAFGQLDVLVNNAGYGGFSPLLETSLGAWRAMMAVNCDGVFLGMKHAVPLMRRGGGGSIVNMSSILGLVGSVGVGIYSASKGAVRALSKTAAIEFAAAGYNIRVNSLYPGFVDTPAIDVGVRRQPGGDEMIEQLVALHPLGRMGRAAEIADAVLFLASDASSFVTGSELVVDGGYTAR